MRKQSSSLYIIALIAMVNMLGYGIIIPILYTYSKRYGLSDFSNGLLFALFSICQFISTPIIGRLSDKYGRRPMLLISIMGTAVSFFLLAFAPNALFLFFSRALDGLTAGNIPVAFAVISDSTKPLDRPKAFGFIGAAFSFGFVFGPATAALTLGFGASTPFLVAGFITLIAVALTFFYLPETNTHMGEVKRGKLFDIKKMWHTLFDPHIGLTFLISLIFFLAFSCAIIYGFQPYTIRILKVSQIENAILFTIFGSVGLISQTVLVSRITRRLGQKSTFTLGLLATGCAFLEMFFSHTVGIFVCAMLVLSVANSIIQTLIPSILSQQADDKSQGSVMGLNASYQSIGMIVGPILGGIIATISIPLTFLAGVVLMIICFILSLKAI